ncbi:transglutaminase family protein [Pullulanibacillus sp. KACC 23026]|uniref:transglutaminase-like domain-containing protein n=1 Tax=Pullulanibacillus sp. KACC 23026 TaxID=3028315 RepID=UPI0023B07F98|nr:transglutaminase family protein [Pullulanibacillus sp. KACC 23026]WEG14553.1 transglutaminase family protein [Pullulanibacillus sp. KACC 23026]
MKLVAESENLEAYLADTAVVDRSNGKILETAAKLGSSCKSEFEKVKNTYEFVRDTISHSWDIKGTRVTCNASEVLEVKEGICYAKSHLLAALLRAQGIPTGFCYQRLMLFDTPDKGYCIHALNAVYLKELKKWIRLDARGNKKGVDAQFSIDEERLAFYPDVQLGEHDYPTIYVEPHPKLVETLKTHGDALDMYVSHLPSFL